jgi:hypothetical protein
MDEAKFNPDNVGIPAEEIIAKLRQQVSDLSYTVIQHEVVNKILRDHIKSISADKTAKRGVGV